MLKHGFPNIYFLHSNVVLELGLVKWKWPAINCCKQTYYQPESMPQTLFHLLSLFGYNAQSFVMLMFYGRISQLLNTKRWYVLRT